MKPKKPELKHTYGKDRSYFSDKIYDIHCFDQDYVSNTIFLYGREEQVHGMGEPVAEPGVDYMLANRFLRNLHILQHKPGEDTILVHMKTNGGWWEEGMAIHNAILTCPKKVIILNETHARSMSSLIFLAADKQVMMPDSTFMFHEGALGGEGTNKQMMAHFEQAKLSGERMLDLYVTQLKKRGKFKHWAQKRIRKMLQELMDKKEDVFLNAEEAVKWGFADEIFNADWEELRKVYE